MEAISLMPGRRGADDFADFSSPTRRVNGFMSAKVKRGIRAERVWAISTFYFSPHITLPRPQSNRRHRASAGAAMLAVDGVPAGDTAFTFRMSGIVMGCLLAWTEAEYHAACHYASVRHAPIDGRGIIGHGLYE